MAKFTPTATYDDVNLVLRLYDMRREDRMRDARGWFTANFHAASLEEFQKLCPPGSKENAYFRQVVSYWDMVASFIKAGVLKQELFFESGRELLLVFIRFEAILPAWREMTKDPFSFHNLEAVAHEYKDWLEARHAGSYSAFADRIKNLR